MEDQTRSLSEVAGLMGVSERTVRRWIKSGRLKAYKPGRDYRIPEAGLRQFIEESEISPKAPAPPSLEPTFNDVLAEDRRFDELNRWIDYAELRAGAWEEQAEREQSPFFDHWQIAVEWDSEVSKEAFALMQIIEQDLWPFADGQPLDAAQVRQVERVTTAVDRLWAASRKVNSRALAAVAHMGKAVRDMAPISRARRAAEERAEKQRAATEDIKRRARELSA